MLPLYYFPQQSTYVNPKFFGAKGDGATDDSIAFQKASDLSNSTGLPVYVPPPKKGQVYVIGTAANPFADGLGGIKTYSNQTWFGDGPQTRLKKSAAGNYVLRLENVENVEVYGLAIDVAANNNFVVGIHLLKADNVFIHHNLLTNSLIPGGANWTIHAVLCDGGNDVRICDNRVVRSQIKVGTNGYKTLIANNVCISPFNQGISWVFQGNAIDAVLQIIGNYIEGSADSGIFFGQDTGVTGGTFTDVMVVGNIVNGFSTNRGILGRYGTTNRNWNISDNEISGGGSKSTTILGQAANTFTVQPGDGASYPASGWVYVGLGTVNEELINYTRVGDTFTSDAAAFKFAHANGSEVWGLTGTVVVNTLGIDIQCAADNAGGPMTGLKINDNDIRNLDQSAINVAATSLLTEWQICCNNMVGTRGIVLGSAAGNLWGGGIIANNEINGFLGIRIASTNGNHEANGIIVIANNNIRGDGVAGNNGNGLSVDVPAGTVAYRAIGNSITNEAGFAADGCGIKETGAGTIHHDIQSNDLSGNTQNTLIGTGIVRNNKGYVTESSGTGVITAAATSVVINHGLSVTPAAKDVRITPSADTTTPVGTIWVDTFTATQMTVRCHAAPGASTLTFGWSVAVT